MQGRTAESLCPARGGEGARLGREMGGKRRVQRSRGWGPLAGVEGPCRACGRDKTGVMVSLGCTRRRDRPLGAKRAAQMKAAGEGGRDRPVSRP